MTGIAAYKEMSITSQSQGRLVVMLYEGAIKNLRLAADAIDRGDWAEKGVRMGKASDIINELDCSLDMAAGIEIAQNLRKLYQFMTNHLTMASFAKDAAKVREVIAILEDLNTAWKTIAV